LIKRRSLMNVNELLKKLEEILLPDKMKAYPPA